MKRRDARRGAAAWRAAALLAALAGAATAMALARDDDEVPSITRLLGPLRSYDSLLNQLHERHPHLEGIARDAFEARVIETLRARLAEQPERRLRAELEATALVAPQAAPAATPSPSGPATLDELRLEAQRQMVEEDADDDDWDDADDGADGPLDLLAKEWLDDAAVGNEPLRERFELLVDAAVDALDDPFSQAIHPREFWRMAFSEMLGFSSTVGLLSAGDGESAVVDVVLRGSDPARKGVRRGDRIVAIDGKPLTDRSPRQVRELLEHPCRLRLARAGLAEELEIDVASFNPVAIATLSALAEPAIGYLSFPLFRAGAFLELRTSIKALQDAGAKAVVLDLRGNPGGLIVEAGTIANLFIEAGRKVVDTHARDGLLDLDMTTGRANFPQLPLAVLIDGSSASASEILAAAFQDHRRALLVGETTYGKGIGQVQVSLPYYLPGASLYLPSIETVMLSVVELHAPNGRKWHHQGIPADVRAAPPADSLARLRARARLLDSPPLHEALTDLTLAADEIAALRTAGPAPVRLVGAALAAGLALQGADDHDALKDVARIAQEAKHPELAACPDLDPPLAKAIRVLKLALKQQQGG